MESGSSQTMITILDEWKKIKEFINNSNQHAVTNTNFIFHKIWRNFVSASYINDIAPLKESRSTRFSSP
jgi:hypothetical protein